jgi:subtilisin family serine protease
MSFNSNAPKRVNFSHKVLSIVLGLAIFYTGFPVLGQDPALPQDLGVVVTPESPSTSLRSWPATFQELKSMSTRDGESASTASPRPGGPVYLAIGVEFRSASDRRKYFSDRKISTLRGAYVITVIDRFADVFLEENAGNDYARLQKDPAIVAIQEFGFVQAPPVPEPERSTVQVQGASESIVRGGFRGATGKNVIIAILDTGIDFRHPDFITYDSAGRPTSRIKYLWDTATPHQQRRGNIAPLKYPNGASIGTLYTQAQLTAELRRGDMTIPATDEDGHGTACASIAAGNGNADMGPGGLKRPEVVGVAPDAEIVGIRMGPGDSFENAYLINGMTEWLNAIAGRQPLILSGSYGGHYSGHDGQSVLERQLNERFPLSASGRAILFAAGNSGLWPIHSRTSLASGSRSVSWNATCDRPGCRVLIRAFFDGSDQYALSPTENTPLEICDQDPGKRSPTCNIKWTFNKITGQIEMDLIVKSGPGAIGIENRTAKRGGVHLYFTSPNRGQFSPENLTPSHLVGSPGAMENAITVGSYDWNNTFHIGGNVAELFVRDSTGRRAMNIGWLSSYSSRGPVRKVGIAYSTFKPEIVAPGQYYTSAVAKVGNIPVMRTDSSENYMLMNGTSAATPYAAGIVALVFERRPNLTLGELKNLLKEYTSSERLNPSSGALPNNDWGYGKLDMAAVERIFSKL